LVVQKSDYLLYFTLSFVSSKISKSVVFEAFQKRYFWFASAKIVGWVTHAKSFGEKSCFSAVFRRFCSRNRLFWYARLSECLFLPIFRGFARRGSNYFDGCRNVKEWALFCERGHSYPMGWAKKFREWDKGTAVLLYIIMYRGKTLRWGIEAELALWHAPFTETRE
jgi:hypothetical protein